MTKNDRTDDVFARIASRREEQRGAALFEPQPQPLPPVFLPAARSNPRAAFKPLPKLDTPAKLRRELERQRRRFAPFLRNLAPPLPSARASLALASFDWRVATDADAADFAGVLAGHGDWQRVAIPHFGPPIGKATAYYRTTFVAPALPDPPAGESALRVRFKGVDYKAHVFVNGAYVGSHEGFFAPFEFDFTRAARPGENTLVVVVENDAIMLGNDSWDPLQGRSGYREGDKVYAATGPGWDDPQVGWHHCPPGMGIFQDVTVEARAPIHIHDVWVRPIPDEGRAEAWIEVQSAPELFQPIRLKLSAHGQNFAQTAMADREFKAADAGPGLNYYRFSFDLPKCRIWDVDAPWLYQIQVTLLDAQGAVLDTAARQFGMRSFQMETSPSSPQAGDCGRLRLNGRPIKLRGANTMGFEQQDVMRRDADQLRDDILLARICHMNYWRLTQRPVQDEVYEMCDRLGFLTQTDLPLFGQIRRNQFAECARQAEEMERLVRAHPCNIMVSYINEPTPGANGKAHRHLTRPEMESFFEAADRAVRLANPDRVTKAVDGDYDPPGPGLPDNHCYTCWYNGHGIELGKLHKGFWQQVKPGWLYGCGEFGAEGLDTVDLMRRRYPPEWLPRTAEEEAAWSPNRVVSAQTGRYHYMFFETPRTLAGWSETGRAHQAWATRVMTEAFRRDSRMISCAIHLFIDAWPDGWMKAIMDCERQPKPAYFAYREALTPLMANLRADRTAFFAGEEMTFEAWVFNDTNDAPGNLKLRYQLEMDGSILLSQQATAGVEALRSTFQGFLKLRAPEVQERAKATLRVALERPDGALLPDAAIEIDVLPAPVAQAESPRHIVVVGARGGTAARLAGELGLRCAFSGALRPGDVILIDDPARYAARRAEIDAAVAQGARAVFLEWPAGRYDIAGSDVRVEPCGMGGRHFVSRDTGHPLAAGFEPRDFKFWFDPGVDRPSPLLDTVLEAADWAPILMSGNGGWEIDWHAAPAAAEMKRGAGAYCMCQVKLAGRLVNPVARIFAGRLLA